MNPAQHLISINQSVMNSNSRFTDPLGSVFDALSSKQLLPY